MSAANVRQITTAPHGHILTNTNVWSPDGKRIVYDVRSDPAGTVFDGERIETVDVITGKTDVLFESRHGACCGVATFSPISDRVVFILGPEHPTPDWQYAANHRHGVIVDCDNPGIAIPLDARDLTKPATAGALQGGTHLHVFSPDGRQVCFTYEDAIRDRQRNVGVSQLNRRVTVPHDHPRNHNGSAYSRLITHTVASLAPGSDQISRASEEAWIDNRRIAFVGQCVADDGRKISEVFVVDIDRPGSQRRLTRTTARRFPGLCLPRHWVRASPDGTTIAMLMKDDDGIAQLWTIDAGGGEPVQITRCNESIGSAFTWHPNGDAIAAVIGGSVCLINRTGGVYRLTTNIGARPEACVVSPDGSKLAFVQSIDGWNQIFAVEVDV